MYIYIQTMVYLQKLYRPSILGQKSSLVSGNGPGENFFTTHLLA